jgi:hypothetical protein
MGALILMILTCTLLPPLVLIAAVLLLMLGTLIAAGIAGMIGGIATALAVIGGPAYFASRHAAANPPLKT